MFHDPHRFNDELEDPSYHLDLPDPPEEPSLSFQFLHKTPLFSAYSRIADAVRKSASLFILYQNCVNLTFP